MAYGNDTSVQILSSLAAVEQDARNMYAGARYGNDTPGLRTLKLNLAGLHSDHLRRLREKIYTMGGPGHDRLSRFPVTADWPKLRAAMISARPDSVVSVCVEAEQKVAQAYESIVDQPELDDGLRMFLRDQLEEIRQAHRNIGVVNGRRSAV